MRIKCELYIILVSQFIYIQIFLPSNISGLSHNNGSQKDYINGSNILFPLSDIKELKANFRLDSQLSSSQAKLAEPRKQTFKPNDRKELADLNKTNIDIMQNISANNEQQVKNMIQMTYRKLAEDFRKLEELMKKQEEVERKLKEERIDKIDGLNNIITIENVHSSLNNYTRVTLSKRKINEIRHRMPLPMAKNSTIKPNINKNII